jgi:hypothetical protein
MSESSNPFAGIKNNKSLHNAFQQVMEVRSASRRLDPAGAATSNPAVARCCKAFAANAAAEYAYRNAMPPLAGAQNIRDFIACVAHGMLTGAILAADGTRFLYAAQVAYSTVETRQRPSNSPNLPDTNRAGTNRA